jgi:biotin carboxyl carrier protein
LKYEVDVNTYSAKLSVDGKRLRYESGDVYEADYSMEVLPSGLISILMDGRSFAAIPLSETEVSVNGRVYRVAAYDPRAFRSRTAAGGAHGRQTVVAPMPGRVIRVLVEAGQEVEAGQGVVVVEAMKMQNEMKAPKTGKVVEVRTEAGAAVAAGEPLVVIE